MAITKTNNSNLKKSPQASKSNATSEKESKKIKYKSLPDGTNVKKYSGSEKWSNRRWAWEFLRRNEVFRKRCDGVPKSGSEKELEKERSDISREFGLKKFKHYRESYGKKKTKNKPSFNAITFWHSREETRRRIFAFVHPEQLVVRFNFSLIKTDRNSLDKQLRKAKKELLKRAADLDMRAKKKNRVRHKKNALLIYLRMLDAKFETKKSGPEIYAMLHPQEEKGTRLQLHEKFKPKYKTAKTLANSGYLTLALGST